MKVYQQQLKNGLSVILVDTQAFPTLTTLLLVGAGSRYETKENNGVAHFFEHMAFKGSKKYPDTYTISSIIEGIGGVFNAFTSKDHTGYWIKSTAEHFETVVDVLADMIKNPLLKEEEIEREKGVIVEEINLYEDTPYRKVADYFEELLYQDNPLGFDIAGTKKTVKSFTRKTFVDYISRLYHPKNAVLVVAGGLAAEFKKARYRVSRLRGTPLQNQRLLKSSKQVSSPSSVLSSRFFAQTSTSQNFFASYYLDIIEEKFAGWKNGEKAGFIPVAENQKQPQIFVKTKKTEQAHFCLGYRAFSFFDERRHPLSVLAAILGGGMSSRLFIEVRERRGLCYYISTSRELYHDCGNIVTQAGVTVNLEKVKEAVEVILKEHQKIAEGQIKKEEVRKAKELLKGRLLLSLEDSQNVATFFGTKKLLQEKIETPEETVEAIEKVKEEEIVALAKEIFVPSRLNFALIGPFEKEQITTDIFSA
ncbi:MAG: M16 family metallopeptidase [Microgenomates group bacterium]